MPLQSISNDQVRMLRTRAQGLLAINARRTAADVVRALVGIQAQDQSAAALAERVRSTGLTAADVARARNDDRTIVRTWAMRGTLHWLAAEDVRWLLALFGPELIRNNRRRREQLGLDEETCARGVRALREVLAQRGPLTRDEVVEELTAGGIRLEGQARPHLLYVAALDGVVCNGPDRGTASTYVLLDDWVPQGRSPPRSDALGELARRYLAGCGPATAADFAAWSGLAARDAREAWQLIAADLVEIDTPHGQMSMLGAHAGWIEESLPAQSIVRLLGGFDAYLLGYKSRAFAVPSDHTRRINAGGGIVHPTLLVDGEAAGVWRTRRHQRRLEVLVESFAPLPAGIQHAIQSEVEDIGRFLEVEATLRLSTGG